MESFKYLRIASRAKEQLHTHLQNVGHLVIESKNTDAEMLGRVLFLAHRRIDVPDEKKFDSFGFLYLLSSEWPTSLMMIVLHLCLLVVG